MIGRPFKDSRSQKHNRECLLQRLTGFFSSARTGRIGFCLVRNILSFDLPIQSTDFLERLRHQSDPLFRRDPARSNNRQRTDCSFSKRSIDRRIFTDAAKCADRSESNSSPYGVPFKELRYQLLGDTGHYDLSQVGRVSFRATPDSVRSSGIKDGLRLSWALSFFANLIKPPLQFRRPGPCGLQILRGLSVKPFESAVAQAIDHLGVVDFRSSVTERATLLGSSLCL